MNDNIKCDSINVNNCCRDYCQRVIHENNDLKKQISKITKIFDLLNTNKLLNVFNDIKNNVNYGIDLLESCEQNTVSPVVDVNNGNDENEMMPTLVIKSETRVENSCDRTHDGLIAEQQMVDNNNAPEECITSSNDINWLMSCGDDQRIEPLQHLLYEPVINSMCERNRTTNLDYISNYLLISNNYKHEQYRKTITIGERVFDCKPSTDGAYRCEWPQCVKAYPQRHLLVRHYTIHGAEKMYACQYTGCGRSFSCNKLLNKHTKRIHSNEKPFVCDWPQCEYKCNDRSSLIVHRRRHTGERPYHCDWPGCSSAFISSTRMYDHRKIHTGEKPFGCDWPGCTFRAGRNVEVRKHKRIHSEDKPFKCDWPGCVFSAKNTSNINQHKRKHMTVT